MDIKNGLTDKEVLSNKNKYGSNAITNTKKNSFISLLIESLGDPIIRILLIALGIITMLMIIVVSDLTYLIIPDEVLIFFSIYFIIIQLLNIGLK